MKKKNVWKRILGFVLAVCLVCTGSFINFGLGIVKAESTVEHTVPSGVARYEVTYNGEALTTLYNEKIPTWTNDTTIYLTYTVAEYTEGIGHQGYCGTGKMQSYPYGDSHGKALTNRLWNAGDESKSKILAVGYTYYVAFDVTSSGMDVRVERVKDGTTETVTLGSTLWTDGGAAVDFSAFKYFGLYLAEATKAKLTNVSIYDENGTDLGVVGNNISGSITKLREPVSQQVPRNVARYEVNYTGEKLTMLYNEKEPTRTGATTIYLTYTVESYTAGIHHQGYCGTSAVDSYPYDNNTGVAKTNRLWNAGDESKSKILGVGYTYFVAFDLTESGMTIRADRVKDGVTEVVTLGSTLCTPNGEAGLDYSTLKYFGLYLGESEATAKLINVSIYDANGKDLGVIGNNLSSGAITKLRKPISQQVPSGVARYDVTYAGDKLTMLYNEKMPTRTGDTTIYLTYTVDSYTAGIHHQGYCGTSTVDSYPYDNNTGVAKTNRLWNEGDESKSKILGEGYTYFVAFDLTESGMTIRADRVKDGVTEAVTLGSTLCTPNGEAGLDYSTLKYFGLYLGESEVVARLSKVSIYDAEGNDLGVIGYNLSDGAIKVAREAINKEIPEDVVGYNVSYKGEELSMLCNRDAVDWLTHTTVYLTYTVDAFSGQNGNQGFAGTSDYKTNWPYGGDPDLGAMEFNKSAETENVLMVEGYTYFVAFDITSSGMECRVERVKDGVTEKIILPKKDTLKTGAWTSLVYFGLYLEANTVAELSNVRIYDESGNDLGVRNSKDTLIYLSSLDINVENDVLTLGGSGSVTASMVNEYLAEQQIEKDTIKEIRVEENISVVSANAFNGFIALEKVYYAKSVINVSEHAFANCASNVVIGCAPGTCFVGGLKNATVVHYLDIVAIGEQTSFEGGTLELHLVPSGAVSGILNETRYSGLSAQIDTGEMKPITLTKTDCGTVSLVLRNLDKENFAITIPKGIAKTAEPFNGVSGFEILDDTIIYVSGDVITMKPMVGVNVHATVEMEGKVKTDESTGAVVGAGFYFNTVPSEDSMPVGGNGTIANIYSMTGSDNGVFINGEKTSAFLRKIETDRYYVSLSDAGYSVSGGDVVTINGAFEYKGTPISFAPITVKYTAESSGEEGIWETVSSGTIILGETVVDRGLDQSLNFIVEGKEVEVLYPNTEKAVSVSDKTVLYKTGNYIVSRKLGNVTFQKSVIINQSGNAGNKNLPQIVGATGAGQYSENYISNVGATESGTVVMSITDGSNTTYQTHKNYDDYGLDYVLDFDFDREIKVLQLSDTQIIDSSQQRYEDRLSASSKENYVPENMERLVFECMRKTVKTAQPDLILLAGDIIYGEFDDKGTSLQALIRELDSYQIPWAPVFGNHDNESVLGVEWQCEQLMKSEYCLFNRRHSIGGNGNYTIGLSKAGNLQRVIYMMDSNFCTRAPESEYANGNLYAGCGFTDNQITWYRASQLRVNQVAGETIPSFLCCHVPDRGVLQGALWAGYQAGEDTRAITYTIGTDVIAQPGDHGYKGADFGDCLDTAMLPFMNEVGTDGAFFGHQHLINTSIYYSGVRYTFGLKTGSYDSHPSQLGGTLISLKRNTQTGESFVINQIIVN